jgi:DNA repair protein RecO (recombination protein O)
VAARIFREPIATMAEEEWPRKRAEDLRRFAMQALERHLERKLRSVQALSKVP